ncbi:MAG: PTS sugar transporter subunit IIA, partial [Gemmatimonadota bacterium]|nr:PTS sugar transporter subunit IIA [Gemmatimonadota bacterium]
MQLTLRQVATHLDVPESTVRRWIAGRGLPAHRVNERLYCNPIELWEWAVEQGIPVSRHLLEQAQRSPDPVPPVSALIAAGGVHRHIPGSSRADVLRNVVAVLPLPEEVDREFLVSVLEAREAMGSTGVGDGIAIPHVRNPILLHVARSFVALCLLEHAVDFEAVDRRPVSVLFLVVSASVPEHLRILAQLGFLLRDADLRRLLRSAAPTEDILARMAQLEGGPASQARPGARRSGRGGG